jgi:putative phosphoesterase
MGPASGYVEAMVTGMRLGILSDIHCNAAALIEAMKRLTTEVDDVIVAGDAVLQYRFSNEVVGIIRRTARGYVLGNHELALLENANTALSQPHIGQQNLEFMAAVPTQFEMRVGRKKLLMVHASPFPPFDQYLYPTNPLLDRCAEVDADFVVLGHTHIAMSKRVGNALVVNPGALGERGDPAHPGLVSYGVLDTDSDEFQVHRFRDPSLAAPHAENDPLGIRAEGVRPQRASLKASIGSAAGTGG